MATKDAVVVLASTVAALLAGCGLLLDEQARFNRALQAYEQGDAAAAVVDLKALLQGSPDHIDARLLLGEVLYRSGDLLAAEKELTRGVELLRAHGESSEDPRLVENTVKVASLQFAARRFDEALANADRVIAADANNAAAYVVASQAAYYGGDAAAARVRAVALLDRRPSDSIGHAMLGFLDAQEGELESAEDHLSKALAHSPEQPVVRLALTQIQIVRRRPLAALDTLSPLLVAQPRDPRLYQLLDVIDLRGSEASSRVEVIAATIEREHPSSPVPELLRGRALYLNGEHAAAAERFAAANAKDGGRYPAIGLYLAERAQGNHQAGQDALKRWTDANPGDSGASFLLATAYLDSGDKDRARGEFERVAQGSENSPLVLNNLAWLYGEINDPRAIEFARRARDLAPDNGAITDTLGWLLVRAGQREEGIRLLRLAVEQAPKVEEIRYHLTLALAEDGANDEVDQQISNVLPSIADVPAPMP